jgi:hypothetical protein
MDRASFSTCSTSASDQTGPFAQGVNNEDFVEKQFRDYILNTDNSGQTLMWHGLATKYQVEPHLLKMLDAIDVRDVRFLYLPLNHWESKDNPVGKCRNKGYAFAHFATEAAAAEFTRKVAELDESNRAVATKASRQGTSANLRALVSAPKKRAIAGALYLQNAHGHLQRVPLDELRFLAGQMLPSSAQGAGRR